MKTILTPKHKRAAGAGAWWHPLNLRSTASGQRLLAIHAKALGDPIRLQLVDVLAAHPGELCACELLPLFDIAQSTLSASPEDAR